jgi:hypothetical protein
MAFKQPNLSPWFLREFSGFFVWHFQFLYSLGSFFHLVRWQVKAQQILSAWSWGFKPSLLSGFIKIIHGYSSQFVFDLTWMPARDTLDTTKFSLYRNTKASHLFLPRLSNSKQGNFFNSYANEFYLILIINLSHGSQSC